MLSVPSKSVYDIDENGMGGGYGDDRDALQKKKGQHRGADGKFEASLKDLDDDIEAGYGGASGFGNHKQQQNNKPTKNSKINMNGGIKSFTRGENDPFEAPITRRKGRGAGG